MAISKVVYGNETLIDLTSDTIEADKLLTGYTAHGKDGELIEGACTFDADTSDGTATASEILNTKTAYVNGNKITGSMPNRGGESGTIDNIETPYTIKSGYYDGSGKVEINATEKLKLIASNIKNGVSILGVLGTYAGELIKGQKKTVTPSLSADIPVLPDEGYDHLTEVTVKKVPYQETENPQGGITVKIG